MPDTDSLRSIQWLMERLGVNERYVRRIVAEGRIPYVKVGHLIRFRESDVDDYILAQLRIANEPVTRTPLPPEPQRPRRRRRRVAA
ncbi:MAG: helix-turn-helix domain-containing protein [Solirubrobacteraceae bacterium]